MGQDFWYYNGTRGKNGTCGDHKVTSFPEPEIIAMFEHVIEHEGWDRSDTVFACGYYGSLVTYSVVDGKVVIEYGEMTEHFFSDVDSDITDSPDDGVITVENGVLKFPTLDPDDERDEPEDEDLYCIVSESDREEVE